MGDKYNISSSGDLKFSGNLNLNGDVAETLDADVDNWNPTGLTNATRIIVDCTSNAEITGITAPASSVNQTLLVVNVGSANLKLMDEDTSSTDANRIINNDNKDVELKNGGGVFLTYVHSEERWFSLMDKK